MRRHDPRGELLEQRSRLGEAALHVRLDLDPAATGYGFDDDEVDRVRVPSVEVLLGYSDAVHARTAAFLRGTDAADLERVVDERWDPPVTLAVRLVSVLADDLQHVGQAAYVRGLLAAR